LAYQLHLTDADKTYLEKLPLSPRARARLQDFVEYGLVNVTDNFRKDPENRPYADQPFFIRDFWIVDAWGDDRWHRVAFTVDDSHATAGKLAVVFVEHTDGEWTW
jgi:hypothetical protein